MSSLSNIATNYTAHYSSSFLFPLCLPSLIPLHLSLTFLLLPPLPPSVPTSLPHHNICLSPSSPSLFFLQLRLLHFQLLPISTSFPSISPSPPVPPLNTLGFPPLYRWTPEIYTQMELAIKCCSHSSSLPRGGAG